MIEQFNQWALPFVKWAWGWLQCLSYWIACIGGGTSCVIYIVTKDKKYVRFTVASMIIYTIIAATGSVTKIGDGI